MILCFTDANTTGLDEFGSGVVPVLINNTICGGNETRLFDCVINSVGAANCSGSGVAGVRCSLECMWIAMSW